MPKKQPVKKHSPPKIARNPISSSVRLQRVLAMAGFGSRRKCEELISDGRVVVDGETVTQLGTKVDPKASTILVDGTSVKGQRLVYFALNKPVGIVTTNRDPQGRPRVVDLIRERERVFPVGRLDRHSEGLILLTNDGDLAEQLAHPRFGVKKTYLVTVAGMVDEESLQQMKRGVHFAEGRFRVDGVRLKRRRGKSTELELELREGKNREIRRILARLGHKVLQLKRIAIANIRLGTLPVGAYRPLKASELSKLRGEVAVAHQEAVKDKSVTATKRPGKRAGQRYDKSTSPKARKVRSDDIIVSKQDAPRTGVVIGETRETKASKPKPKSNRGGPRKRAKKSR